MNDASDEILNLINDKDFSTIQVDLKITNSTTRMDFKASPPIKLVELTEQGMVLEIPERSCAENHNLVIDAQAKAPNKDPVRLTVTAKVDQIEPCKDGTDRISLSLVQVREEEWNKFRYVFSSRQDEIDAFLISSRGY